jgi:hypothetical protein
MKSACGEYECPCHDELARLKSLPAFGEFTRLDLMWQDLVKERDEWKQRAGEAEAKRIVEAKLSEEMIEARRQSERLLDKANEIIRGYQNATGIHVYAKLRIEWARLHHERDALAVLVDEMREALQLANGFTRHSANCASQHGHSCNCGFYSAQKIIERDIDLPAAVKIAEARREVCIDARAATRTDACSTEWNRLLVSLAKLAKAEKLDG